jgi:RHS repeat-associated protein
VGVILGGSAADGNIVQGNYLGADVTGSVANNGGDGVNIENSIEISSTGNTIQGNAIFGNSGLGIDPAPDGVTPNDSGDAGSGPNNLQNFPLLADASSDGSSTTVEGSLNSSPNTNFRLEFFASTACDPSGYGEGERYLGSSDVTTDANGDTSFSVTLSGGTSLGEFVTATATDERGNTSEFSACVAVTEGAIVTSNYHWRYEYDGLNRLTYACSDWDTDTASCVGDAFDYSYDGAGNLLSFSRWDEAGAQVETVSFVYNSANQIACLDGGGNGLCGDPDDVAYSYDAYGNLTSDGTKTYTFDAENRLVSVTDGASTTSYAYNGDGDRVSQTVDGVTTSYVLDTAAPLTLVLTETTGTETIYYLHGLDLVAQNDGAATEYFAYDGLGSVRQMLDSGGGVLYAQVFDPYGNPYASAGTGGTSFGFTGEQTDENGLIFLRARYYDPRQGRFLQRDPWSGGNTIPMSYNPWLYAYVNPISYSDPSGWCLDKDLDGKCDNKKPINFDGALVAFDYGPPYSGKWKDDGTIYRAGERKEAEIARQWEPKEQVVIRNAASDVARAYARAYNQTLRVISRQIDCGVNWYLIYQAYRLDSNTAFLTLHDGKVKFVRRAETATQYFSHKKGVLVESDAWAQTQNTREIYIFDNATANDVAQERFIVHELGHTFESALEGTIGKKAGRLGLTSELWFRNVEGVEYGGFAGKFGNWQWSQSEGPYNPETGEDGRGEIFADMFIGWVYGRWGENYLGDLRETYMNNHMPVWIFTSMLIRGLP